MKRRHYVYIGVVLGVLIGMGSMLFFLAYGKVVAVGMWDEFRHITSTQTQTMIFKTPTGSQISVYWNESSPWPLKDVITLPGDKGKRIVFVQEKKEKP